MRKALLILLLAFIHVSGFAQMSEHDKVVELGKAYYNFMFRNEPPEEVINNLKKETPASLNTASAFILQTLTSKNKLLTETYLRLPDEKSLQFVYTIVELSRNMYNEHPKDADMLADSLLADTLDHLLLCDRYYDILFTAIGNKNQPFNMSKVNFDLKSYNLKTDTEKGIFFLECMHLCNSQIYGYMNIVHPANTKKALEYIEKYPSFNGQPYYQYLDLGFPDFQIFISDDLGLSSFKGYYIDKYYDLLLAHLTCLKKEGAKENEINDLLLGSILKDQQLYQYTENKQILINLFKEEK